jgi:hypothetical protein
LVKRAEYGSGRRAPQEALRDHLGIFIALHNKFFIERCHGQARSQEQRMFSRLEIIVLAALALAATTMMVEARNRLVIDAETSDAKQSVAATATVDEAPLAACLQTGPDGALVLDYAASFGAMMVMPPPPCEAR